MIIIACVDDNFGLLFNKRRLSRDINLIKRIYEITKSKNLYIREFSRELFDIKKVGIAEALPTGKNDALFIEDVVIDDFKNIEKIILYHWNRSYPSDFKFIMPKDFKEVKRYEFEGNSHEKISEVEYEKIL